MVERRFVFPELSILLRGLVSRVRLPELSLEESREEGVGEVAETTGRYWEEC